MLVILDNCEHVLPAVTIFARGLASDSGSTKLLATSREPLETPAEHIAWRTGLYRVSVDGGIFLGPFLSGVLGMRHAGFLPAFWTLALAVTGLLLLARARRSSTMAVHG